MDSQPSDRPGAEPNGDPAGLMPVPGVGAHPAALAASRSETARLLDQLEQDREQGGLPLRRYLHFLLGRRRLILGVTLGVVFVALLQVLTTTPLYRASATLQIDPEGQAILPREIGAESLAGAKIQEEYLSTQARKLQSRTLALRLIEALDLTENPSFTEPTSAGFFIDRFRQVTRFVRRLWSPGAGGEIDDGVWVDRFLRHLGVEVWRNTRLIQVSFTSPDPHLASEVANRVVEEFIEQNLETHYQATNRVTEFLSKQLEDLEETVEESEEKLIRYARENDIVNLNERETLNAGKLADLIDELTRVEGELIELEARYQEVARATIDSFPQGLRSPTIVRLEGELSEQRRRLAGLASRHGPGWPAVQQAEREIAELEGQLRAEKRGALRQAREAYRVAVDRHQRLGAAVEEQRAVVDRLNRDSIQYRILQREVETNKDLYESLLQRLKEAGVSAGLNWSNLHLADRAGVPRHPAYPNRSLALVVALVLGLFLGVGASLLAEAFDDTFASTEEVAQTLGLPALGLIPVLEELVEERKSEEDQASESGLIPYQGARAFQDPAWEAYRSLRTSILLSHSGKPPQTILVTSALPGEGKSTTVANTAIVLAQTGARTLILDLDMRKPTMARLFGVSSRDGMSTFLTGHSDLSSLVQETGFSNLFIVPAGPPPPNPAELVGSERMRAGLEMLTEYFDHIIVDSPPCLEITDALVLSTEVDGLLLVVRAGKTPKELVRKASDRLLRIGGTILGVLVNAVDVRKSAYGYYHSYYRSYDRSGYGGSREARVRRSA